MRKLQFFGMGLTLLLAFFITTQALAGSAADAIQIHDPYTRAVPPGQPNSAVFMQLKNTSAQAHAIVNASSDVSKVVELHTHRKENGMMKMRRIDKMDIPANGETMLKPGGLHIMLIGLKNDLKLGQKVAISIEFEDGSKKDIIAPVRKIKMNAMMKQMKH